MKKILPKLVFFFVVLFFLFPFAGTSFATSVESTTPTASGACSEISAPDTWCMDADVTFAGKMASRSGEFLTVTLANYPWSSDEGVAALREFWKTIFAIVGIFFFALLLIAAFVLIITRGKSLTLKQLVFRFLMIVILVTLSFSILQFLYFIADILQGMFLAPPGKEAISAKNLLSVAFTYSDFIGYRKAGATNDEAVFFSVLLVKLTSITYFVMAGLLLVRKVVLWFFLAISPVFPLLLLFAPIRNTAKIWVGEFFRWLLYAPIFAILLSGLVALWSSPVGVPLTFPHFENEYPTAINILIGGPGQAVSETNSINTPSTFALYVVALFMLWAVIILPFILLQIFLNFVNALSPESDFVKHMIATTTSMIGRNNAGPTNQPTIPPALPHAGGMAKALPSTEYFSSKAKTIPVSASESSSSSFADRQFNAQTNTFSNNDRQTSVQAPASVARSYTTMIPVQKKTEILHITNLVIPTLRDVAKYETSMVSSKTSATSKQEVSRIREVLTKIADPSQVTNTVERERFVEAKDTLTKEGHQGNPLANAILSATNTAGVSGGSVQQQVSITEHVLNNLQNPTMASTSEQNHYAVLNQKIIQAQTQGDPVATQIVNTIASISSQGVTQITKTEKMTALKEQLVQEKQKGNPIAAETLGLMDDAQAAQTRAEGVGSLPSVNRVQSVSLDDYEAVKDMWQENYQNLEPPVSIEGTQKSRKEWIEEDIEKIRNVITLLLAQDPQRNKEGMDLVADILPFLLVGGFSQSEVIAYLKSKLEAAKVVLSELEKKENEEDTLVLADKKQDDKQKEMHMEAQAEVPESTVVAAGDVKDEKPTT